MIPLSRMLAVHPQPVGEVVARLRLENTVDGVMARRGALDGNAVRIWEGSGVVDTGAIMLAIPVDVADSLGLEIVREAVVGLADGSRITLDVRGPLELTVANRSMTTEAIVWPLESEVLIGQIVLERLDLLVDCQNQTLVPRPESPLYPSLQLR